MRRLRLFSVCLSVTTLASSVSVYTCLPHDTHGFILQSDLWIFGNALLLTFWTNETLDYLNVSLTLAVGATGAKQASS